MVQDWKTERYGSIDCEDIEVILGTMTKEELLFESSSVMLEWRKVTSHCGRFLDDGDGDGEMIIR